ncbi:MAG TPA: hypothetical protein VF765_29715 [Polyangiaceae bacterium]
MASRYAGLVLLLAACQGAPAPAAPEPERRTNATSALPAECILFLSQLDCWLRKVGNEPEEVDVAVGAARATFESRPSGTAVDDTEARCERAMAGTRLVLEAIDCESVYANAGALPPADPVVCPADQHFFIRRDGWIAGCHPDCATSSDCHGGGSCSSIGSSPGGPIEEAFCE